MIDFWVHRLRSMCFTFRKHQTFGIDYLDKNRSLLKGGIFVLSSYLTFHVSYYLSFVIWFRCSEDIEQHFEDSVLSKMPDRYKSHLKQSVISEEDDMGNYLFTRLQLEK